VLFNDGVRTTIVQSGGSGDALDDFARSLRPVSAEEWREMKKAAARNRADADASERAANRTSVVATPTTRLVVRQEKARPAEVSRELGEWPAGVTMEEVAESGNPARIADGIELMSRARDGWAYYAWRGVVDGIACFGGPTGSGCVPDIATPADVGLTVLVEGGPNALVLFRAPLGTRSLSGIGSNTSVTVKFTDFGNSAYGVIRLPATALGETFIFELANSTRVSYRLG
jgi:hypothetical protein